MRQIKEKQFKIRKFDEKRKLNIDLQIGSKTVTKKYKSNNRKGYKKLINEIKENWNAGKDTKDCEELNVKISSWKQQPVMK